MAALLLFQFAFILFGGPAVAVNLAQGKISLGRAWAMTYAVPGMTGFAIWLFFAKDLTTAQRIGAALGQFLGPWAIYFAIGLGFPGAGALFSLPGALLLTLALGGLAAASVYDRRRKTRAGLIGAAIPVVLVWYGWAFMQLINNV